MIDTVQQTFAQDLVTAFRKSCPRLTCPVPHHVSVFKRAAFTRFDNVTQLMHVVRNAAYICDM